MARSTLAPQNGFEYQALFFWIKALDLLIENNVTKVEFESSDVTVVDDVVVHYNLGHQNHIDYFQLKYHIKGNNAFSAENLLDASFSNTKDPLLVRLFEVYTILKDKGNIRLFIISTWSWHPDDFLSSYIEEGAFSYNFFRSFDKKVLEYKGKVCQLLKIEEDELNEFLSVLRFEMYSKKIITEWLNSKLKAANLELIDFSKLSNKYEQLPWKFYKNQYNEYNKETLIKLLESENLFMKEEQKKEVFFIQSYPHVAEKYLKSSSHHLDLSHFFKNFSLINWLTIKNELKDFASKIYNSDKEVYLLLQTRLSISLYFGYILKDQQAGIKVIPTLSDLTPWNAPLKYTANHWDISLLNNPTCDKPEELILICSVTHDINLSTFEFLKNNLELQNKTCFSFVNKNGCNSTSISDDSQAWSMANELADELSRRCLSNNLKIHIFYAGPSALAYIIGKKLQLKAIELYLYEYNQSKGEYVPSINVQRGE